MSRAGDAIDATIAAERLRTLSNPTRLRIVLHLLDGERAVGDLEVSLALRQPGLSHQLGELRDAGFVVSRREAKAVFYRLADGDQRRLVQALVYGFGGPAPLVEERPRASRARAPMLGACFAIMGEAT